MHVIELGADDDVCLDGIPLECLLAGRQGHFDGVEVIGVAGLFRGGKVREGGGATREQQRQQQEWQNFLQHAGSVSKE